MNVNNLPLLTTTEHGVPSGNYDGSSLDFYGDAVKAVNYYQGQGSIQTIAVRITNFVGIIKLQATLNDNPNVDSWVDHYEYTSDTPIQDYFTTSITGNFSYMRVQVLNFESGTIESIVISY